MSPRLRDEQGLTLPELMVAMLIGIVVLGGIVTMVTVTAKSSGRISERVAADQVARPMVQRIMDELHSACIAPGLAPIQAGSTDTAMTFITAATTPAGNGNAVSPEPVKRTIALSGTNLNDTSYAKSGGTAPENWTFSSSGTTYRLLANVAKINASTPIFSYYAYSNGSISATPLAVPLSAANAAKAVEVRVNLAVKPSASATSGEAGAPIDISNSVLMRFTPSSEDTSQAGLPCT